MRPLRWRIAPLPSSMATRSTRQLTPPWSGDSAGRPARGSQHVHGPVETTELGLIESLLLQTEPSGSAAADLDHDGRRRWTGVKGDDVELVATDAQLAPEDDPALSPEERGDPLLGCVPGSTARRSTIDVRSVCRTDHRAMLHGKPYSGLTGRPPGALLARLEPRGRWRLSPRPAARWCRRLTIDAVGRAGRPGSRRAAR